MAAAVLDNKAARRGINLTVASAGTADYHVGEGPNDLSLRVWSDAGFQYQHIAQQFVPAMFDTFDHILVMDQSNRSNVLRLAKNPEHTSKVAYLREFDPGLAHIDPSSHPEAFTVPDPWGGPRSDFEHVLSLVESAVDGFLTRTENQQS